MAPPTTYAEWSVLFRKFCSGDDTALDEMQRGQFLMDAGTASRFCVIAEEAYKTRKQLWLTKFQRAAAMENIKSDDDFAIILRNGRQSLVPLSRFIFLKGLPQELSNALAKDLEDFVSEIRNSLKDNLSKSSGSERMIMQLNTFCLMAVNKEESVMRNEASEIPVTRRKIIF